jgi:hypothetical protein
MNYVTYDGAGKLTGAYLQDLHASHVANHIEVTPEQRINWVIYQANSARDGVELAPVVAPIAQIPQTVTMRQARLALNAAGLLSAVQSAINAGSEEAKITWEYSSEVQRNNGLVPTMAASLGMTETQIDNLFIAAAAL